MDTQVSTANQKLTTIMKHASTGLAELDAGGDIHFINLKGEELLRPVLIAKNIGGTNFYAVLDAIAPALGEKIRNAHSKTGKVITNELHSFTLSFGEEEVERHFSFSVIRMASDCIIIDFNDVTENLLKEKAITELVAEKAVEQGKFEIASNVLHDIGNALVGFGSYINRVKRSSEHSDHENLQKLTSFLSKEQTALNAAIGEVRAEALVKMAAGISESHRKNKAELLKSVTEQLNILNHIQEILHIQKQYLNGHSLFEKKPINLRAIINDCILMLYASMEKRGITLSIKIPEKLPDIQADRTRLMQVILNLLKNSIEAIDISAKEKNITLSVRTGKGSLILLIRDTGSGFDTATGKELFTRGFTTKASGTGLGLNNCKAIIESHGGSIDISSDGFGKGALITIEFKI